MFFGLVYKRRLSFIGFPWGVGVMLTISSVFAQQQSYPELAHGADLVSAFNRSHTYIGVPAEGYVYTYAPLVDTPDAWRLIDSTLIPEGTIAIDGNIRKTTFLLEDRLIFKERSSYDTLVFDDTFMPVDPRTWVRTPYSTETDVYVMENGKQIAYYSDGGDWFISDTMNPKLFRENKTVPSFDEQQQPFGKLYSFRQHDSRYIAAVHADKVLFHRYDTTVESLNTQAIKPEILAFELPNGAVSAFVYDGGYLGVVFSNRILFYYFDKDRGRWAAYSRIKPFILADIDAHK